MRRLRALGLAVLLASAACARSGPEPLRVFAAASTFEVVTELCRSFPGGPVSPSFGPTSGLARQILDGAPADLFLSANRRWVEELDREGALIGPALIVARNRLVCVVPADSALLAVPPENPAALSERLGSGDLLALADAAVPAGDYARRSLESSGVLGALGERIVGQKDVRAVLRAVERGDVAAGVVYATDARRAEVVVLFPLDESTHPPIEFLAAVTAGTPRPAAARAFLEHLRGPEGRRALEAAGFLVDRNR